MNKRITAGELSKKAKSDNTNYNLLELGHAVTEDVEEQLYKAVENYKHIYNEDEFCVVRQSAMDSLHGNAKFWKYYCWLFLPKPRPDQAVFLYNKKLDRITKRLWILPSAARMAELSSVCIVPKEYQTMQAWSIAFFEKKFWEYVRHDQGIDMLSECEYMLKHRQELIDAGCKVPDSNISEPFDFSKVAIKQVVDS